MRKRTKDILIFAGAFVAVVMVNILAADYFFRWDLTEDNRYSIAPQTVDLLEKIDQPMDVTVYLSGDLPPGYQMLKKSIEETLDEFKIYAGRELDYGFVDPFSIEDSTARMQLFQKMARGGIKPKQIMSSREGKREQKVIFPGALIAFDGKMTAVQLFKGNKVSSEEEKLMQSIEGVEFEFASAFKRLTQEKRKKVAFTDGHGELNEKELNSAIVALSPYYDVGFLNINTIPKITGVVDALIIAQPKKPFTEAEKFKLDQFVMNGGKLLFYVDAMEVRPDTIGMAALYYDMNISDLLFKYGVRLNRNMVQDLYCALTPYKSGEQVNLLPNHFMPVIYQFSEHPIVRNMPSVMAEYVGTVDTVKAEGVRKTPLMFTSKSCKVKGHPVVYSYEELKVDINEESYDESYLPISFLLEGEFTSLYRNRPLPPGITGFENRKDKGRSQIFVCSDGDILKSDVNPKTGAVYPMGYNRFTDKKYSNEELLINSVNYLLDEAGVVNLRSKVVQPRPLDKFKVKREALKWKIFNMVMPVVIILILGFVYIFIRKRRYGR